MGGVPCVELTCAPTIIGALQGLAPLNRPRPARSIVRTTAKLFRTGRESRSRHKSSCASLGRPDVFRKARVMAFDDLKMQISLLLTEMQNEPEDRHELYLQLKEKLNELKAVGMPLPDDLVKMAKNLEDEFASEQPDVR